MGDTDEGEPFLNDIYDAAIDRTRWPAVLGRLARHFGSASAHLSIENVQSTQGSMISYGTDPDFDRRYGAYYVTRNVLWQTFLRRPLPGVICDRQIMPKDELCRSEFYNDFLAPQDGDDLLIAPLWRDGDRGSTLTLWRPSTLDGWQSAHAERLRQLTPHLTRAVRIGHRIGATQGIRTFSAEALYRLGRGLFIVGETAHLMFANRIAEALLAEQGGLRLQHGRLCAPRSEQTHALHRAIAEAARRKTGGTLLARREGASPLLLMVLPVGADAWQAVDGRPGAMVLTRTLGRARPSLDAFAGYYRLTPAETRAAQELTVGDGIAGVAARLGVSVATARTHLIRLFQKTGARRQAELVRIVMEWSEDAPERAADETPTPAGVSPGRDTAPRG